MEPTIQLDKREYNRLLGIEESYAALQKAYAQLTDRIARPPVIEPNEAERNKVALKETLADLCKERDRNARLRGALNSVVECL